MYTISAKDYLPRGNTLAPNKPRYSTIFLIDFRRDMSIKLRRPSAVPEDCIILCIERSMCFKTATRLIGNSPTKCVRFINEPNQVSHQDRIMHKTDGL